MGMKRLRRRPAGPPRYSAAELVRHGLTHAEWPRVWRSLDLERAYDVVVIGAGVHGLATSYYLAARHGITKVAVLDKGYVGGGGSGRNTAIVRANYLTPEGVRFYDHSVKLYESLATELNFNIMFARRGHLTLAHTDGALRTMTWRAEVNKLEGVDSEVISPEEIKRLVPFMDISRDTRYPILGALYHPPGGIVRHDAVNWGYARAADFLGVQIHQGTEVLGITTDSGSVTGVDTTRGHIAAPVVVNCTAGWSSLISEMVGLTLPIITHPLQAAVTEPVKMFLESVVVSGSLHVYVSQTDRGELVFGASTDPYASVLDARLARVHRGARRSRARADAVDLETAGAASVGGAVRPHAGFLAHHGSHARQWVPLGRGLGHLWLQGGSCRRRGDSPAHRKWENARADRRLRLGTLPRGQARERARRGRRRPLRGVAWCDPHPLSQLRPAQLERVRVHRGAQAPP